MFGPSSALVIRSASGVVENHFLPSCRFVRIAAMWEPNEVLSVYDSGRVPPNAQHPYIITSWEEYPYDHDIFVFNDAFLVLDNQVVALHVDEADPELCRNAARAILNK